MFLLGLLGGEVCWSGRFLEVILGISLCVVLLVWVGRFEMCEN